MRKKIEPGDVVAAWIVGATVALFSCSGCSGPTAGEHAAQVRARRAFFDAVAPAYESTLVAEPTTLPALDPQSVKNRRALLVDEDRSIRDAEARVATEGWR